MKFTSLLLILCLFCSGALYSQDCPTTNIIFSSQFDIDNFKATYPDCTEFPRGITIQGLDSKISNLDSLINLTSIRYELSINNTDIQDFSGLQNLTSVGGYMAIHDNKFITDFSGLESLTEIEQDFNIYNNEALTSFSGLDKLSTIGDRFQISDNHNLETLIGLNALNYVRGDLRILNNYQLVSITGFESLDSIGGTLGISYNEKLTMVTGFDRLIGIRENLQIQYNEILQTFSGLNQLTAIGNNFSIFRNDALTDLSGLNNLASIGNDLSIELNPAMNDIIGLEGLTHVGGTLNIENNAKLKHLNGLMQLATIGADLNIYFTQLTDLAGLNNLTHIGSDILIESNTALESVSALNNLTTLGGIIRFERNPNLTSIEMESLEVINSALIYENTALVDFKLSALTTVKNDLDFVSNPKLLNFSGLNQLDSIYGEFQIGSNDGLVNLLGLDNLSFIGHDLKIAGNLSLINLSGLFSLQTIGQQLFIFSNASLVDCAGFQALSRIDSNVLIQDNDVLSRLSNFPALEEIGGYLRIDQNYNLDKISGFNKLTTAKNDIIITKNGLTEITGFQQLQSVGGQLEINNNYSLTSISGFDHLETINRNLSISEGYSLVSLSGFQSLQHVGGVLTIYENFSLEEIIGFDQLTTLGSALILSNNNNLRDISGLSSLTTTGGGFRINNNSVLESLDVFKNLTSINGDLRITSNESLQSLNGLENILYNSINFVTLNSNVELRGCNQPNICTFLDNDGPAQILFNGTDCKSIEEIQNACEADLTKIRYEIFFDFNRNKIFDADEKYLPNAGIFIAPTNALYLSNATEGVNLFLYKADHTISFIPPSADNWELSTDSAVYHIPASTTNQCDTLRFGVYSEEARSELVTLINAPPARCGEFKTFDISTTNSGSTVTSGTFWINVDDNIAEVDFIDAPDSTVSTNWYGWHFEDLYPGHSINRQINLKIPGPLDFPIGDELHFLSYTDFTDVNGEQRSVEVPYDTEVRCAFDPNDKLVYPNRNGNYTLFEESLIYTVRFQNTGNDEARRVVIRDTLDQQLDPSTFKVISSSHFENLLTTVEENQYLVFDFKNISLPDSTTNYDGSQGYVSYMIEAKDGTPEATAIKNSASIYFDFNPAVQTNTTTNIMVEKLPTATQDLANLSNITIYPNPTSGIIHISNDIEEDGIIQITDYSGKRIVQRELSKELELNLLGQPQGIYFIFIQTRKSSFVEKIILH